VQTERLLSSSLLLATRRPRARGERWPILFHGLSGAPVEAWETDRLRFIGRGRSTARPALAMVGTVGNVLDPAFSLRTTLDLAPDETRTLEFTLGVVEERAQLTGLPGVGDDTAATSGTIAVDDSASGLRSGFSDDGSEYWIDLPWEGDAPALPPLPWINVIANERFGCLVSETGAGCTWSRNSQANRLTPWSNDPVSDPHGEALYLRDEASGKFWSPQPGPAPAPGPHRVRHGFGYSRFSSCTEQLEQELIVSVARQDPVKILRLRLHNRSAQARRLSLFAFQQLVLGSLPAFDGSLRTWRQGATLCAQNERNSVFADGIAFSFAVAGATVTETRSSDRRSFVGDCGSLRAPAALRAPALDGACEAAADPCFARQLQFAIAAGGDFDCALLFGEAVGEAELAALLARYRDLAAVDAALDEARDDWAERLGGLRVQTPSPELDRMVNGWLPYQALSCRLRGRTAYYQSSGAYGFRDQLQDAGNLALLWPDLTRRQLLLHARQQFAEGDVLHWWHPEPDGRGLRTRFADDLLWLPYVAALYIERSGDRTVLDETIPFLRAPALAPGEDERYLAPDRDGGAGTFYEHCCRAIDRSLTRGAHGLPLMGTGDWNDGMNRVGREGRGESVWLAFFLCLILDLQIPLARARGDQQRAARYAEHREALRAALDAAGWDGGWYRRAYYDDGTPLGTRDGDECRIDALVQAWAVLSGAAPPDRAAQAMNAAEALLVSDDEGLIRLLTPPFVDTPRDPGYIRGYVAGVRENGGQYTHAACWVVEALAKLGRRDRALRMLTRIGPLWHARDPAALARYRVEPYVIAADIYGAAPHVGRGGWTWYTGSAGLAWRVAVEAVMGLRVEQGRRLCLRPCVPDDWPGYRIDYRLPGTQTLYRIEVRNPARCTARVVAVMVDGGTRPVVDDGAHVELVDDGAVHDVIVTLGY
jgi:cyclic beta-1,2-glucan synthetase